MTHRCQRPEEDLKKWVVSLTPPSSIVGSNTLSLPVWFPALKALHQLAFPSVLQRETNTHTHTHTPRHTPNFFKPLDKGKVLHEQHLFGGRGFDDKGPTSETRLMMPLHQKPAEVIRADSRPATAGWWRVV